MKKHEHEDPPKQSVSLDLVHRLLELADQYHVHVAPPFRNEMMRLQDHVVQAMNLVAAQRLKSSED